MDNMNTPMAVLGFALALAVDLLIVVMSGTVFFIMWAWLIVPTFEYLPLTWTAALIAAFVVKFLTGTVGDIPDVEDFGELMLCFGEIIWHSFARNVGYLFTAAVLLLVLM